MIKVITYGSYDLLHYGHIRLLERAKALGDYLIVGVTADDFDKRRGKINTYQSLMERVEAVRTTGIADEIIIEEYEGQKIDDIKRYDVDIFTVGSDWVGKFDYLNEYCKVVYLPRTEGISSSEIREKKRTISFGLVGDTGFVKKVWRESTYVNGLKAVALCTSREEGLIEDALKGINLITSDYDKFLENVDAVYIRSQPTMHYEQIKKALLQGKHVLCESPLTLSRENSIELLKMAQDKSLILMEAIKTAYTTAFLRLLLLIKSGEIGDVVSVNATCTSVRDENQYEWNGIFEWGPTALLPVMQILGIDYVTCDMITRLTNEGKDSFSRMNFLYNNAVGSITIGDGVKAEGELIVSGTEGYIYVPAPWWKTDYFEIRYEDQSKNKRFFYQLDGEGIRYELVAFSKAIERVSLSPNISRDITVRISEIMDNYLTRKNMRFI